MIKDLPILFLLKIPVKSLNKLITKSLREKISCQAKFSLL